jgi:hypothetical protein
VKPTQAGRKLGLAQAHCYLGLAVEKRPGALTRAQAQKVILCLLVLRFVCSNSSVGLASDHSIHSDQQLFLAGGGFGNINVNKVRTATALELGGEVGS